MPSGEGGAVLHMLKRRSLRRGGERWSSLQCSAQSSIAARPIRFSIGMRNSAADRRGQAHAEAASRSGSQWTARPDHRVAGDEALELFLRPAVSSARA